MKRVLFIDHSAQLGGAELYLRDLVPAFPESTTLTFEAGELIRVLREQGSSARVIPGAERLLKVKKRSSWGEILRASLQIPAAVAHVVRAARSHDVLFANSQKALIVAGLAGWLTGRPVIWNLHDMLTSDHFGSATRAVAVRWANAFVDRVIVNSEATRRSFVEAGGEESRTRLVFNGLDPMPFNAVSDRATASLRADLGIGDAPCVGVFSRLAEWKGQHVLLEALADLPDVHAIIVGDALFDGDAPYANRLRTMTQRLGLGERIHFLGFRTDIPALMRMVDVVVHTSTAPEPFGRVIVEGLLARRPVIATRAGGAVEILESIRSSQLTPPGDSLALRTAIEQTIGVSVSSVSNQTATTSHRETLLGASRSEGASREDVDRAYDVAVATYSVENMRRGAKDVVFELTS